MLLSTMSSAPEYDSVAEAKQALSDRGVPPQLVNGLFESSQQAAAKLVVEYNLNGEIRTEAVARQLMIGFVEIAIEFAERGTWNSVKSGIKRLAEDMDEKPIENASPIVGRLATRYQEMSRLMGEMVESDRG